MKKYIMFLLLSWIISSVRAQVCFIHPTVRNLTFPYVCLSDSFVITLYSPAGNYDTIVVHWGDNTSDTLIGPQIYMMQVGHLYSSTGIYYPYLVVDGYGCNDTILEFLAWGRLHPGSQDSLSHGMYNYVIVVDSCTTVSGKVYIDKDSSCTFTAADVPLVSQSVMALNNNVPVGYSFTDGLGNFTFAMPLSYQIRVPTWGLIASLQPVCGATLQGNYVAPDTNNHFIFRCPDGCDAGISSHTSFLAQTVYRWLHFTVKNYSCNPYNNATVTFYLDNRIIPDTSSDAIVYGNNGTWGVQYINWAVNGNAISIPGISIPPMGMVSGYILGRANPQLTTLNDTVCFVVSVSTLACDGNPVNNTDTICAVVLTSYDPNDKAGICNDLNADGIIPPNKDIIYTIRFQNTGNFPAKDIRVVDTLDVNLEHGSIEILSHSHPVIVQQSDNVLIFFFNDIWLPDSTSNEPESHGHVTFRIKQQPNLPPLTQISNFVDIYFDYNPPIRTNTVVSVIENPASVATTTTGHTAWLYPNPASSEVFLFMNYPGQYRLKVYNLMGAVMCEEIWEGNKKVWNTSSWQPGIYLVEVIAPEYRYVSKLQIVR